jgi:hypothetical protein
LLACLQINGLDNKYFFNTILNMAGAKKAKIASAKGAKKQYLYNGKAIKPCAYYSSGKRIICAQYDSGDIVMDKNKSVMKWEEVKVLSQQS